jgi:transcriptional regulator with XRE-family HTH domain
VAAEFVASSGVPELDEIFGGLYWGDNVVWMVAVPGAAGPFYAAVARTAADYHLSVFVTLTSSPAEVAGVYPGFEVLDARPGTPLEDPDGLLATIRERCRPFERDLILFDSLEAMTEHWGEDGALRFFTHTCPLLLELGAIAYWTLVPTEHSQHTRREIEEVTQCVLGVSETRLRIAKAEGRPPGVQGSVYRYGLENGRPALTPAPAAARLGAALLALRANRGLTQGELARLAGVSPSAISQAERGLRGLSLETLLELTARLGITLDELLRGEVAPGYRLARRHDPSVRADAHVLPLLDDAQAGLRAYLIRLPPRESVAPGFAHKGVELVAVAIGLVQVVLPRGRPVLRPGESLLAEQNGVLSWRNVGEGNATLFWILRDDPGPDAAPV